MRLVLALIGALALVQCASGGQERFRAGQTSDAMVIIGVAETTSNRDPRYSLLWRLLDANGEFLPYDDARSINARTHSDTSVQVRGIPGEFEYVRVAPGAYALDSAYAVLRENNINYTAQGLIEGPNRPVFEVRAGEVVYLGIWEMDLRGANAVTRLWRLDEADLAAVRRAARLSIEGDVRLLEPNPRAVPCHPQRMNNLGQRQVC